MKKITLTIVSFLFVLFTTVGCRVSKSITMLNAKTSMKLTEEQFLQKKNNEAMYLNLSNGQKSACEIIWKEEKDKLARVNSESNEEIAPVVYESEVKFRELLNSNQLVQYKKEHQDKLLRFFLSDKQLSEIKRIYIDKN
ncbi:hypothetical protein [Flavobacterium cerinum]|uniref:Lipoprotein n=1 Tax=Flavobacterium cerinum TaxID=2502784 RepID=A0ABY5IRR3_9FLAO|nr:hypothetical protein [Flavobacterium cerinum]UUC45556.1 hypothetical protein NOX80_18290 [Flavobacterium cerinum]